MSEINLEPFDQRLNVLENTLQKINYSNAALNFKNMKKKKKKKK